MNHRETQARKTYQDAQRAVIKACEDLREAEMFLDSFECGERSAVGGAAARVASSADVANTHASNLRESVVGGAAAEYLAREWQQGWGQRTWLSFFLLGEVWWLHCFVRPGGCYSPYRGGGHPWCGWFVFLSIFLRLLLRC